MSEGGTRGVLVVDKKVVKKRGTARCSEKCCQRRSKQGGEGFKLLSHKGFEFLGPPIGTSAYCEEYMLGKMETTRSNLRALIELDDAQVAYYILRYCEGFCRSVSCGALYGAFSSHWAGTLSGPLRDTSDYHKQHPSHWKGLVANTQPGVGQHWVVVLWVDSALAVECDPHRPPHRP